MDDEKIIIESREYSQELFDYLIDKIIKDSKNSYITLTSLINLSQNVIINTLCTKEADLRGKTKSQVLYDIYDHMDEFIQEVESYE